MSVPAHRTFGYNSSLVNELGHRITLDLERNDTLDAVRIFMGGPTSDGTWRLTMLEAKALQAALAAILGFTTEGPARDAVGQSTLTEDKT